MVVGAGPAGLQAAIAARAQRAPRDRVRAAAGGRRAGAARRVGAEPGRVRRHDPQPARPSAGGSASRSSSASACGPASSRSGEPDHVIVATGAEPTRPWWVPADAANVGDVRDVLDGRRRPSGDVVVVDEIGFHHATSVAELLADRGCRVEIVTPGMVVGQDLGITLDMENWWIRAGAKGIVQTTDLVPMGMDGPHAARCCTTRPAPTSLRQPDWVVLAVHAEPGRVAVPRPEGGRRQRRARRRLRRPAPRPRRRDRRRARRRRHLTCPSSRLRRDSPRTGSAEVVTQTWIEAGFGA